MNVLSRIHYVAYLLGKPAVRRNEPHAPATQIGEAIVSRTAPDRELSAAIKAMQKVCAEHAGLT